jgi:DNA polymerase-3 subunit delta'
MALPFYGNEAALRTLEQMRGGGRLAQTLLLHGPGGVGKATLARRFGAELLGHEVQIEQDDLSLPANSEMIAEREKLQSDKRNDDPLLLGTHPDFLTFPPDGPLRQISIEQIRTLKERAQFGPSSGKYRIFLIDQVDRANENAANSLLKVLEEPPPYLLLIMTAENVYDLLPTIRSRAVMIPLSPLEEEEMERFAASRRLDQAARRVALAAGCPGKAVTVDIEAYDRRRAAMLTLLEVGAGMASFGEWVKYAEPIQASKNEKLDAYLETMGILLEDVLLLQSGWDKIKNPDIRIRIASVSASVSFRWVQRAAGKMEELRHLVRRNIQKGLALDAMAVELVSALAGA